MAIINAIISSYCLWVVTVTGLYLNHKLSLESLIFTTGLVLVGLAAFLLYKYTEEKEQEAIRLLLQKRRRS